jgi:hypothetical protein
MPRDEEAAALRPTLFLALVISLLGALVLFWPRTKPEAPIRAAAPPPAPISASAVVVSSETPPDVPSEPPVATIEVTVIVPAPARPGIAAATVTAPAPATATATATATAAATATASASVAASASAAPTPSEPVVFIDKPLPRNTQPDRSEPARVTTKVWDCPWPPRGSKSPITQMKVHVKVTVTAEGQATGVEVLDDPGLDFGGYAKSCALTQRYLPAKDAQGRPTSGITQSFAVLFDRSNAR